jgi:hypothetical protein
MIFGGGGGGGGGGFASLPDALIIRMLIIN